MTEYHSVNLELSDFQRDKLKAAAKNATAITLRLSLDMIGNGEANFSHKLLLNKDFANKLSRTITLSKNQVSKIIHTVRGIFR